MKKIMKKMLVFLTVLSIGVVGLTACGNKNNDNNNNGGAAPAAGENAK